MKRHIYLLVMLVFLAVSGIQAQIILFQEGFESTPGVTSGGTPGWSTNTAFYNTGLKSYSAHIVNAGDSSVMITNAFSTVGVQKVTLEFSHICKIEFIDAGEIYVSANNGVTWTKLTETHYKGSGGFSAATGDKFTSTAYVDWLPGNPSPPLNTWWKPEVFDISSVASNAAQVKVMFMLRDMNNQTLYDNWGWAVDDIKIWTPSPQEASVEGILLPFSLPSGCGLTNETIRIRIANNGGQNINGNLTASFKREGMTAVTESVPNLIIPDDTVSFTFTNKIDLSSNQDTVYEVKVWVSLLNDPNQLNDTLADSLVSRIALPPPVCNDTTIPFGTSVTLHAIHQDSCIWYSDPQALNLLVTGSYFTTPVLYDTTTFYVQAGSGGGGTGVMPELLYYKFDVPGTTVANEAMSPVGSNPATITGTALTIGGTGMIGSALVGTGGTSSSNVINTGWATSLQGSFTISFWTSNITPSSTLWYIWGDAGASTFRCFTNGVASANNWMVRGGGLPDLTITGSATMNPNYIHVVYDAAAGQLRGYIDGVLTATATASTSVNISGTGFQIGGYSSNSGLSGLMDEFRIYNRALTQTEITQSLLPVSATCPSIAKPVKVSTSNMPQYNAGITAITSPVGAYIQGSIEPVVVTLKNYASDTLKKVMITYSVNGIAKTPYLWTGNLPYNQTTSVTLGTDTFYGGAYTYKAWTSMPNDSVDDFPANDTASVMAYVCLAGTFTLGDAGSDFPDFASLQTILANVGICGNTTVRIKPGTYNGQLTFTTINGASDSSRITLESYSGLNNDVIIQYMASSTTDNWTVRLDGADYITFRNLTIKANNATYGRVVELINGALHNVFEGNRLITAGTSNSATSCVYDYTGLNHYNTYLNNYMEGGYYTIYVRGSSSTSWTKGTVIQGNEIVGSYYYPMYVYYSDSVQIIGNKIHSGVAAYSYGIYCYYANNQYRIIGNTVNITATSSSACYGIQDYYGNYYSYNPLPTGYGLVANNMISITGGTATHYGLYSYYGNGTETYYNTVNIAGGGTSSRALYQYNTSSNTLGQTYKNNIFSVTNGGGFAAYYSTVAQVVATDYNNYYSNGSYLAYWGGNQATLAALKLASGKDQHSYDINPPYMGVHDLRLSNTSLSAKGTPLTLVTDDIFGTPRGNPPTIGAHEVPLIPKDAGVVNFIQPTPQSVINEGGTVQPVVTIQNFGTDTLNSVDVYYSVNGGTPVLTAYTGQLIPFQTAIVNLTSYASPAGITTICAYTVLAGDSSNMNDTSCVSYYATPITDAVMVRILPVTEGCGLGPDTIRVVIRNNGATPITGSYNVSYTLEGSAVTVTQAVTTNIPVNDSLHITFDTLADFSTAVDSIFLVKAWASVPGDNVLYNDTASLEVVSLAVPSPPLVSDTTIPYASYVTLHAQSQHLVYWYDSDTALVEIATGYNFTTPVLYDTATYWVEALSDPLPYISATGCPSIRVPVMVNVMGIPPYDIGVDELLVKEGCAVYNEPVTIHIFNQGTDTLKGTATASYRINNTPWIPTETIPDSILPGGSIYYTFNTLANLTAPLTGDTMFTISVWIAQAGDPNHQNDTIVRDSIMSLETPAAPLVTTPVNIPYGTSATLTAQSPMPVEWFASDTSTVLLDTGYTFITPPLFDTTTFWAQAGSAMGPPMSLYTGTQSSNYQAAQTRGYHFTAPVNMTITELMVPITVTSGPQYIQVVKFQGYPLVYPNYSPHTTLAYIANAPFGVPQQVNIPIQAGDEIGIIGATLVSGTTMSNSYGQSQVPSSIGGIPVTLTRLVYQNPLVSGPAPTNSIALEVAASIARVDMTYVVGGLGCPSLRVPVVVNTGLPPAVDAGISEVVEPAISTPSGVQTPIKVRIKNYGANTLVSANIVWSLNSVIQDTLPWTGSLPYSQTEVVTIDTAIFAGGTYCISAWTFLPNGVNDSVPANDTATSCFNACMTGTYSIGPATTGTYDFNNFNSALSTLIASGICGHVVFEVHPGTYNEQLTIAQLTGANINNTVTFRGYSGDSTDVVLQYTAVGTADNWTVRFDGADYFRFEKMTIKANNASYGRVVEMINGATRNRIESCRLMSAGSSTSTTACVYDYNTLNHYNTYLNNRMEGGYYTMYIYGISSTSWEKGTVIQGNEIVGSYYYPMYIYYSDSLQIIGNKIHSGVAAYSYGIYCYYANNQYRIIGNTVNITATSSSVCYGIRDYYGNYYSYNPSPSGYGLVANNMVCIQGGTGAHYGLYSYYGNGTETYYNSVHIATPSASGRALYQGNTTSNTLGQTYKNNIFSNSGGGYAAYFATPASVTATDYNNFYSSASNLAYWGGNQPTLAALQTASGKDLHSYNINPPFNSLSDLHLANTALSAKGTPIPVVTVDIDGDPRGPLPTIGADEIPLIPKDAGVTAINSPGTLTSEGQTYPIIVTVTNFGTDSIKSMNIEYSVNNGTPVSQLFNDTLLSMASKVVTLPSMISPAGNSTICAKTILAGDTNYFNDQVCKNFFGNPMNDGMVTRIVGLEDGCNVGLDTISIWVKNLGANAINSPSPSTVTVKYRIKPTAPFVSQTFTPVINPNDSVLFHFTTLADFSAPLADDTFYISAWIDLQGDNVKYNDTAHAILVSLQIPPPPVVSDTTIPYGTSVTLFAQSQDTIMWYAYDTATVELATGSYFTTPVLYSPTTYWVEAISGAAPSSGPYTPGVNIAPQATASASTCNTGACSTLNDLNLGTCGTQQMWISTSSPPDLTPHVNWLDFEWPSAVTIDGMTIHHAQNNARFLTGATMYKWDAGNWVSFHTFSNLPMQCINVVPFPLVTTTKIRLTSFQMTGTGQTSNPNFREIEVHEAVAAGCSSIRVPLVVSVSNQAACDVGVSAILEPITATNLGSQENVKVRITNYGTSSQVNFPVSYKIDNMPVVTETVGTSIPSNGYLDYSFTAKANLSIAGNTYQFKAWPGLSCDNTPQNDTAWKSVSHLLPTYCPSTATSTLNQEITNVTLGTMSHTSPANNAMYTNHITTALPPMLSPGVSYQMSITSSLSPGSSTSQNCWVKAWVDFNRDGTFDPVTEMIFSSATTSSNTVSASVQIPYTAMNGNTVMRVVLNQTTSAASVAPCGNYTYGETEDYMVTVAPQASCDAGVIAIMSPDAFTQSGTLQPVWVKFMNFGSNPITAGALSVAYRLNNGTPVVMPYPGSMAPGAIDSLQMTSVNIPMGNNALCAYTILGCDSNMFNNEICKSIYGQYYTTLPYFDNFETSNMWYKPSTSTNWQYGTPSANIINTAYSGVKAWVTNLTGDYSNNASEYLYSPMFDFSGLGSSDTITLSFYHWCAMATSDYGRVQYSDDGGQSWSNLGFFGDPMGTNWYNTQSGGVHYFSITNSGWMYSAYKLDPYIFNGNPLIQFRFHFYSNASGTSNGWAIDNYRLALPLVPNDVGITAINTPINDTAAGSQAFTTVTISNFGTSSQYMIPLEMELNGVLVSAETWTGTLASQASTTYTFILPYAVPVTSYQLCAKTLLPGDPFASNDAMCRSYGVQPAYHDVGVGRIMSPLPDSAGRICLYNAQIQPWYQYYIAIKLHNYGQNAQVSIPVKYTFYNGGPVQTSTWTGSLVFGDSADFLLSTLFLPNAGIQQVCVETDLLGDMVSVNNKYCQTYNGVMCIGVEDLEPEGFALMQNVPNPAKGTTLIGYSIPQAGDVTFGVVSLLGQVMHSEVRTVPAGQHQLELDVSTLAAGVYYYFAEFNGQRLTKKLVINR